MLFVDTGFVTLVQWRRQLWGTGARAPWTSNNCIFSSLGVNLTANYRNIV